MQMLSTCELNATWSIELTKIIQCRNKKNILIPNVAEKKYSDFGGGKKKKSDSEFLSYNLMSNDMLNSGKKFRDKKNKCSNSALKLQKIDFS